MKYKVCKLRETNGEELIIYETNSFFKAFKEYNRLKFKYPSLYFKLYYNAFFLFFQEQTQVFYFFLTCLPAYCEINKKGC